MTTRRVVEGGVRQGPSRGWERGWNLRVGRASGGGGLRSRSARGKRRVDLIE